MINRVLIRIKVVQLLYSYLLSQEEFKIEGQVENPSRDRKYAYRLYMDLLLMVLELSGYNTDQRRQSAIQGLPADKLVNGNQLAKSLSTIGALRELILLGRHDLGLFADVLPSIYRNIPELPAYKSYAKAKKHEMKDDVELWLSIIHNLFAKNAAFQEAARRDPEFTLKGFNDGIALASKTLAEYGDNRNLLVSARNALDYSLDQAYKLYNGLFLLADEITRAQEEKLEELRNRVMATDEERHPDLRFVENKFIRAINDNPTFAAFAENSKFSWETDFAMVESLRQLITESADYKEYMAISGETTWEQDCELWRNLFKNVILPSDTLAETLESKSIYWNDDLHVMGTFVLKTIRKFSQSKKMGEDIDLLPQYKDEEDRRFGPELFKRTIDNYPAYKELIDKHVNTSRWDADRLAFMDIVIMVTAIAEITGYPAIPLAVSFNEYIEIANYYSTPKSGQFINGILYAVVNQLKEEGKLHKA